MSDRWAVAVAVAAVAGALLEPGLPGAVPVAAAGVVVALMVQRPLVLALAAFVLTGGLAAKAEAGLVPPPTAPFAGWVTALTDPEPFGSGIRLDVRDADGRHLQAEAYAGRGRGGMQAVRAGERL